VLTLYLAALIFGLGMFAVQALSSAGADGEHPALPGGDADAHAGETWLAHHTHAASGGEAGWASIFVSLRFYMFAAIAFGVVGVAPAVTLGAALLTALVVATAASLAFRALGHGTLSSNVSEHELMGQVGRVLVACEKGRKGKVRLTVRGQIVDFVATTDEERLAPGAGVIVQEVHAERVHVCAAPRELLAE
jgi:membrane protein implicated in regulation of membrane protease activity